MTEAKEIEIRKIIEELYDQFNSNLPSKTLIHDLLKELKEGLQ